MSESIGEKIKMVHSQSGIGVTAFAKKLNKERSNIYDIFKRESIDTQLLEKIGQILNHNFFEHFTEAKNEKSFEVTIQLKINDEKKEKEILKMVLGNEFINMINK